ncbi:MAG TPA: WbqC family protein [Candidatus Omnitrophota bacterium]|nr:WbqC family protein [Candidatus Omnitrophota bacterium]
MIVALHQPQYLPWLGYFHKIAHCDQFVFLDNVQYKDREFQNRNKIRTKDGPIWLTVPVSSKGRGRQIISRVLIDNGFEWKRKHLAALKTSYGHAAFFERYFPFFEKVYGKSWERLSDLNFHIIEYILKELGISKRIHLESALDVRSEKTDRIVEICRKLGADTYLSGAGGKDYLEEDKFPAAGIKLVYQQFDHPTYRQQFMKDDKDFMPYMSVVDLLFNEGPQSREILKLV